MTRHLEVFVVLRDELNYESRILVIWRSPSVSQEGQTSIIDAILPVSGLVRVIPPVQIAERIIADEKEIDLLCAFSTRRLATIIHEIGFFCDCCAQCCTRSFNGHVFLLDRDTAVGKEIDPAALEPAPWYEFCDQHGIFYVSGYAVRTMGDAQGSCWFISDKRCRIYDRRFSICRIYPYMLHREPDASGFVDWRQIAGLDLHGEYHTDIPFSSCLDIAQEVKEYEMAVLLHEIAFLKYIEQYFRLNRLRHVQKMYDDQRRLHARGVPITVRVFYSGQLEEVILTR
jgi:hypothetical protein